MFDIFKNNIFNTSPHFPDLSNIAKVPDFSKMPKPDFSKVWELLPFSTDAFKANLKKVLKNEYTVFAIFCLLFIYILYTYREGRSGRVTTAGWTSRL